MHLASPDASSGRRADIDWLRVCAFGLLILYHVILVFAPWDWHVHSTHTVDALRYGVLVTNPWRLTLLFLVSGVALRFLSRKLTPEATLRSRMARLAPAYLFGVLILVPPQAWLEALDKGYWSQGLLAWMEMEFSPANLINGVPINHLWFLLYIIAYSLAAVALSAWPRGLQTAQDWFERNLTGWRLIVWPILYLMVCRQILFSLFGLTNAITHDWYNHAMSLGVFLFGFCIATSEPVWREFERLRWAFLKIAVMALPLLIALEAHPGGTAFFGAVKNTVFAVDQWAMIGALLGFASFHLRKADGPLLRYLTDAVFPCYLAHQTILVIAIYLIKPAGLPVSLEAPLLITITLLGSLAVYEIVKRIDLIRPLWGLKPRGTRLPAPAAQSAEPARN